MFFDKIKQGLSKTKQSFSEGINNVFSVFRKVDEELLEELEETLIMADVGMNTTEIIIEKLRDRIKKNKLDDSEKVKNELKNILIEILSSENELSDINNSRVILMVGVNGVGKTTTLGKLANYFMKKKKKVVAGAADTFRAAAVEQLEIWGNRSNIEVVKGNEGADPASVVFDALKISQEKNADILICDTAGRLHNKKNLMDELSKINKIIDKSIPENKKEVLLVLDATTGQNGITQAKEFAQVTGVTGIVVTKLDGTAKGGMVFAIMSELGIPVRFIGVGEGIDDFYEFNAKDFVDGILD